MNAASRTESHDHAAWWIVGSNALAILAAVRDEGGYLLLLWVYWIQSVVIGLYARRRMLALRRFVTDGLRVNDRPVPPTPASQRQIANFFALHYGGFHLAYLAFLLVGQGDARARGTLSPLDWLFLTVTAVSFWLSHRASHREHVEADLARLPNLGSLMILPYARVVPMHIAIVAGAQLGGGGSLTLFALLKTAADLVMHKVEHRWLQRARRGDTVTAGRPSRGTLRTALLTALPAAFALLPAAALAQGRELSWPSVSVTAHLDSAGRLHVSERQVMRFTGDWNGGARTFTVRLGQEFTLRRLARIDPATGTPHDLRPNEGLGRVDDFAWPDITTLRWRSRLPTDPPFARTELTYLIEVLYGNIIVPLDDGTFRLSHDFAFTDRVGPIERFDLTLTLDPVWRTPDGFTGTWSATGLEPGSGWLVTVPLRFAGEGRPGAVLYGTGPETRRILLAALAAALATILILLLIRERRLGRFAALPGSDTITKQWLDAHVFSHLPEVVGAAWDDHTAAPEVAATLARLVQERKLSSAVRTDTMWVFKKQILELKLEVPRGQLCGHERTLVDALFRSHETTTDTERVRERYKSSGFDPAALIRERLAQLVELTTPGAPGAKPSTRVTFLLVLAAFGLIGFGFPGRSADLPVVFGTIGLSLPAFAFASILALVWRQRVSGMVLVPILFVCLAPLLVLVGAFAFAIIGEDRFRTAPLIMAGLTLWLVALCNSVANNAKSRHSAERIALRKRLAAARQVFRAELAKPQPALLDEWFPYLIAFGLGSKVDRWFRAFGGTASADTTSVISTATSSGGSSHSAGSGSSWTGFGGGGGFAGAGSSASFAAAVGGMAASVPSPSSSSSGGGGGGGGGSSGGGGGGGW